MQKQQIQAYKYADLDTGYKGPTKYRELDIPPWSHPQSLVNEILLKVKHSIVVGLQFNGPMGEGKSKAASVIAHHIHLTRPEFDVRWVGANEFRNMNKFLESLPKYQPLVIIFDDITSAIKSMPDKEIHRNFNSLTRVRHIIDPEKGKTPIVIITIGHYSKNMEKEYRNVLIYSGFFAWTNDEQSNIETIAPKNTQARFEVLKYAKLYARMSASEKFVLKLPNGQKLEYKWDDPFRPFCVVRGTRAKIILFDEKDCCEMCTKKVSTKMVPPLELYQRVKKAYGPSGIQALKMALWKRGYYRALPRQVATSTEFLEERLFPEITTDFEELVNVIWKQSRQKPPKRLYHKTREEEEFIGDMHDLAVEKTQNTSTHTDNIGHEEGKPDIS